jgi:hypothetical protein
LLLMQLLANRIQMLKKEESKALKKIENTRQRASHILSMREENERKLKERLHILQLVSCRSVHIMIFNTLHRIHRIRNMQV